MKQRSGLGTEAPSNLHGSNLDGSKDEEHGKLYEMESESDTHKQFFKIFAPITELATNMGSLKKFAVFRFVKLAQLICVIYILLLTFSRAPLGLVDPLSGDIIDVSSKSNTANGVILVNGDYRPVVAEGTFQKVCLAISRISAFSMYPVMIMAFLTKCKATVSFFNKTPLSMYMINDCHELHIYAGRFIAFDVWVHTLFHLLRWADQGNTSLLWEHRTGLTGLVVVAATPLITFPMMYWKKSIQYELRKGLHYLFYLFAIGMCYHVPTSGIPNGGFIGYILGFCIFLYTLDTIYVILFMSEKIETTTFQVLSSGVLMVMDVSESFQKRGEQGGYAYVCLPWVARNQWHAFSLFENPGEPCKRQVFMLNNGDWTNAVHKALQRKTVRPVWVQGPFVSPYCQAEAYDNQILVASGIGITPALSVIRAHKDSRRCNLIWAVRDPAMLEFFMEQLYLDHDGWNLIFYTGTKALNPAVEAMNGTNVRLIKGRPDLKIVIPNIICGIESGAGLPETYTKNEMVRVKELILERMHELDDLHGQKNSDKLVELTAFANSHGFILSELINDMQEDKEKAQGGPVMEGSVKNSRCSAYDLGVIPDNESIENLSTATGSSSGHRRSDSSTDGEVSRSECPMQFKSNHISTYDLEVVSDSNNPDLESSTVAINVHSVTPNKMGRCKRIKCPKAVDTENSPVCGLGVISAHNNINPAASGTNGRSEHECAFLHDDSPQSDIECPETQSIVLASQSFEKDASECDNVESASFVPCNGSTGSLLEAERKLSQLRNMFAADQSDWDVSKVLTSTFNPWEKNSKARDFVKKLDKTTVLSTWGILYCGGNKHVERDLRCVSTEYRVSLNVENFAW